MGAILPSASWDGWLWSVGARCHASAHVGRPVDLEHREGPVVGVGRGRLTGLDTGFLAMERDFQPMVVGSLAVLEDDSPALTLDWLRDHVRSRLDVLPSFRWLVVPTPGGLAHPVTVATEPDLDQHVVRVVLEGPGDRTQLEELLARMSQERLPADRPLWRLVLVDGLADGRQALFLQFHHALADGSATLAIYRRLFSDLPVEDPAPGAGTPGRGTVPGRTRLLLGALLTNLLALVRLPRLLLHTWRGVRGVRRRRAASRVDVPPFSEGAPWTALNDAFTSRRTLTTLRLPLAAVRAVRAAAGVTVNDVVLTVVSGAVRRLLDPGDLPSGPLLVQVPVADPASTTGRQGFGNAFWSLTTTLAAEVADPLDRLHRVAEVAAESKARLAAFGVGLVPAWLDLVPPRLVGRGVDRLHARLRTAGPSAARVDATTLVSNLRGPEGRYTCGGRTVGELFVLGPPSNGIGLNVCVLSYADHLDLSVLASADAMPRPADVAAALGASWAELAAALGVPTEDVHDLTA